MGRGAATAARASISSTGPPQASMAAITEPVAQYLCAAIALIVAALVVARGKPGPPER